MLAFTQPIRAITNGIWLSVLKNEGDNESATFHHWDYEAGGSEITKWARNKNDLLRSVLR